MPDAGQTSLATFLKDRRTRLNPAALGFAGRRRTPGLRREEVAQRANISTTWYTWLEQGRGGAPSADVLNRIAKALMLTEPERDHMYMLALGRLPEVRYTSSVDGIAPRLQRVLDRFETSPAMIKTATWQIVGWNRAATLVMTDYAKLPPNERNVLRFLFGNPEIRKHQYDWEGLARFAVGSFRAHAIRAGAASEVGELVEELSRISPEFASLWRQNEVIADMQGFKRIRHPILGDVELEYSSFAVDGRPDLDMVVYNPVDRDVGERIRTMVHEAPVTAMEAA
ncbi:transcriptional regulator with XRE-family HTH domain [Rhizobium aquaticum]|uniref:Transcriptional regulator with XRE-family HTH domain n=1 Tax=Rhizobium aquaticum TaxID=1549636 RepID=A0ABV2IUQ9_9HYPH